MLSSSFSFLSIPGIYKQLFRALQGFFCIIYIINVINPVKCQAISSSNIQSILWVITFFVPLIRTFERSFILCHLKSKQLVLIDYVRAME